jgi:hypothetical protein
MSYYYGRQCTDSISRKNAANDKRKEVIAMGVGYLTANKR